MGVVIVGVVIEFGWVGGIWNIDYDGVRVVCVGVRLRVYCKEKIFVFMDYYVVVLVWFR